MDRYGLGLLPIDMHGRRLIGMAGGLPGFFSIVLSTDDGQAQLAVMINLLTAAQPVYQAFIRTYRELGEWLRRDQPN